MNGENKVTLTVEGLSESEHIVDRVVERLVEQVSSHLHDEISAKVFKRANEIADKVTEEEVRRLVSDELAKGWPEYSRWGAEKNRVTLAEHVIKLLEDEREWGGYGRKRETWLAYVTRSVLEKFVRDQLAEEAQAARAKFAAMVDDVIKSKLAETMRNALGLKS